MKPINLQEHPEGGRYREVYRSKLTIHISTNKKRSALTHIYFSLKKGEISLFHKVKSDEVWNLYEGEELVLYLWNEKTEKIENVMIYALGWKLSLCFVFAPPGMTSAILWND